jgi:membrane protein
MVLVLIAIGSVVIVPVALKVIGFSDGSTASLLSLMRWPLLFVAILFALACLYRFGPNRERPQWRWVTSGSAIAAGIWIAGSLLMSWYVANFGTYNATYGSLGAIIGFLIWMWLSTIVVLTGAEINAETEHQTARDSTEGGGKPIGTRGCPTRSAQPVRDNLLNKAETAAFSPSHT